MSDLALAPAAPIVLSAESVDLRPHVAFLAHYPSAVGRAGALGSLRAWARLLGHGDPRAVPWYHLRREHTTILWTTMQEQRREDGAPLAPTTLNHRRSILRAMLEECWLARLMTADEYHLAVKLKRAPGTRLPAGRHVPESELWALLEDASHRDRAILSLLFASGIRRAELAAADLDRLAPDLSTIRVVGKSRKEREAQIAPDAQSSIRAWLAMRGPDPGPLFASVDRKGRPLRHKPTVDANGIPTPGGLRRITTGAVTAQIKALAAAAGLAKTTPHDFRRTFAGNMIDRVDLPMAKRLMGHENVSTTERYDRRQGRLEADAVAKLSVPIVRDRQR